MTQSAVSDEFKQQAKLTEQHGRLHSRLVNVYADINKCQDLVYKTDLLKIYKNINTQWAKLDNEMIACRTWHKLTPAYLKLYEQIERDLKYLDKHLMWTKLL